MVIVIIRLLLSFGYCYHLVDVSIRSIVIRCSWPITYLIQEILTQKIIKKFHLYKNIDTKFYLYRNCKTTNFENWRQIWRTATSTSSSAWLFGPDQLSLNYTRQHTHMKVLITDSWSSKKVVHLNISAKKELLPEWQFLMHFNYFLDLYWIDNENKNWIPLFC